ncbi:hypothetical protein, partial [Congregibacter sp.]
MAGAIDIVVNPFTATEIVNKQNGFDEHFMEQVRMPEDMRGGVDIQRYAGIMDEAGVDHSLLIAVRAGGRQMKYNIEIPYEQVAGYCREMPTR